MVAAYSFVPEQKQVADTPFARFLYGVMQRRGGLSQRQVQTMTGISASQVGDWIYKGVEPKAESVNKIAPWLKMRPEEIWQIINGAFSYEEAMQRYEAAYDDLDAEIEAWIQQGLDLLNRRRSRRR